MCGSTPCGPCAEKGKTGCAEKKVTSSPKLKVSDILLPQDARGRDYLTPTLRTPIDNLGPGIADAADRARKAGRK